MPPSHAGLSGIKIAKCDLSKAAGTRNKLVCFYEKHRPIFCYFFCNRTIPKKFASVALEMADHAKILPCRHVTLQLGEVSRRP
jgi:hypothetical protein